jgi:hypothetical protein
VQPGAAGAPQLSQVSQQVSQTGAQQSFCLRNRLKKPCFFGGQQVGSQQVSQP